MGLTRNTVLVFAAGVLSSSVWAEDVIGLVFPVADVQLSVPAAGVVQSLQVRLGQHVAKGQTVLVLEKDAQQIEFKRRTVIAEDMSAQESSQERLRAINELAQMTMDVARSTDSISKEELLKILLDQVSAKGTAEQLIAQKARERVEVQAALNELQQRTLVAPVAGTVVALHVDPGEWAKPGDEVARLVDSSQVELRLNMLPKAVAGLKLGTTLQASFEDGDKPRVAKGKVIFISPIADASSGLVDVRVVFDNKRGELRPGSKAVVQR